jgi:hypothetical protein
VGRMGFSGENWPKGGELYRAGRGRNGRSSSTMA